MAPDRGRKISIQGTKPKSVGEVLSNSIVYVKSLPMRSEPGILIVTSGTGTKSGLSTRPACAFDGKRKRAEIG